MDLMNSCGTIGRNTHFQISLIQRGLKLLCQNYRCKFGELDLIMKDGSTLVFVEVRYRKSDAFGTAAETITKTKQSRIITTAQTYMAANRIDCPIRFDVVAISGKGNINWIKNAF